MPVRARIYWWLLVLMAGGILAYFVCFPQHLRYVGVNDYGVWFIDTYAIMASNDALAHGLDVYRYNPLDCFGRPHVYPHWWLWLGRLGLTRADTVWLGLAWGAAYFAAAVARLRPRSIGEVAWNVAILCSPAVLLALNRGNNDLVLFVLLTPVAPLLLARSAWAQAIAVGLIALAMALKTYPAIAVLVLLAGTNSRVVRWRLVGAALVLALMASDLVRDFRHYGGLVPRPDGLMTFGAAAVFEIVGAKGGWANLWAIVTGVGLVAWLWRLDWLRDWRVAPELAGAWLSFVLGATLLTGCFFAGMSFGYRWIFAVWLLPLLWILRTDHAAPRRVRWLANTMVALLTVAVWLDALTSAVLTPYAKQLGGERVTWWADTVWHWEQPLTWALFAGLLVFMLRFAREGWATLLGRANSPTTE